MSPLEKKSEHLTEVYQGEKNVEEPVNPILEEIKAMTPDEYAAFDKKLMRKIDMRIIPWMT